MRSLGICEPLPFFQLPPTIPKLGQQGLYASGELSNPSTLPPLFARYWHLRDTPPFPFPGGLRRRRCRSTEGEASGTNVHAGEAEVPQRRGQGQAGAWLQLQLQLGLVQQLLVQVTGLVHLQPVQLGPQPKQLSRQLPVLSLHLPLRPRGGVRLLAWSSASFIILPFLSTPWVFALAVASRPPLAPA